MPFPPTIEQLPYNWSTDRAGQQVVAIVAHGTGGSDSRAYLSRGGDKPDGSDRKVSIHCLIRKDGTIYRYVPDERGANHAGAASSVLALPGKTYRGGAVNRATLGFELENWQNGLDPYPAMQLLAMGWLITDWRRRHGLLPLVRHGDLDPTRRRDPYQLTVATMEQWAEKAAQPPTIRHYRVKVCAFWLEDRRPDAPIALNGRALLEVGTIVAVDDVTNGWCHDSGGLGFVPLAALEAL